MSDETLLKPREYRRDALGMFERPGATMKNTAPAKNNKKQLKGFQPGQSGNPKGRPKGVGNKVTVALKEAILLAAERAGGEGGIVSYLERLAVENSSAFSGLLGKVLPATLAADPESHGGHELVFRRIIVWPGGREEEEGVTPKQLPAPSPVSVENNDH